MTNSIICLNKGETMNIIKKSIFRTYQFFMKLIFPLLPYKDPIVYESLENATSILKDLDNVLIVTDKAILLNNLNIKLENILKENQIKFYYYDQVVANPTSKNVLEALEIYKKNNCHSLIALGGGSVIDTAKAVGAMHVKKNKTLRQLKGLLKVNKKIPTLIAIPTTAGTGSETTLASVVVDSETRYKYAINDFVLIPKYAILDASLTLSMPLMLLATTGMDALTHAIESYLNFSGNSKTDNDALEAIKLIFENIENSYDNVSFEAKRNMLYASFLAGKAFSRAYVGNVHALAHAIGGKYNLPHGYINAIILPIVLKEYGSKIYKKMFKIAKYCQMVTDNDSHSDAFDKIINKIITLNEKFNIPKNIDTILEKDFPSMAKKAYKEANPLYPVPVMFTINDFIKMYRKIKG